MNAAKNTLTLNNGVEMPLLGLGTYLLRGAECERCVAEAAELGYRLFDSAQMYGNEREVGRALRGCGVPREELFVTTKIYSPNTSFQRAKSSIESSLRALGTEYIDLLLIHEPYISSPEIYCAMREAYEAGYVRAIGVSNFNEGFYSRFLGECGIVPAVDQVEAHLFFQQDRLRVLLAEYGTAMQAWSPFAASKNNFFQNPVLRAAAERLGRTPAHIALRFLVQRGIAVVPKTARRERMAENAAIFDFSLSGGDMAELRALDEGRTLFGWY